MHGFREQSRAAAGIVHAQLHEFWNCKLISIILRAYKHKT